MTLISKQKQRVNHDVLFLGNNRMSEFTEMWIRYVTAQRRTLICCSTTGHTVLITEPKRSVRF